MERHDDLQMLNRRWRPALMSFFLRRVRHHAEAEDLTQEVFARLIGSVDAPVQSPDAYIFQVAANLLRDRARRGRIRAEHLETVEAAELRDVELLDPYRIAAARESMTILIAGLEELPQRTREIFILYKIENLDQGAIAESYGVTKSAVKKHVMKAMAHLIVRMRNAR